MERYIGIIDDVSGDQEFLKNCVMKGIKDAKVSVFWSMEEFMSSPVAKFDLVIADVLVYQEKSTDWYHWLKTKTRFLVYASNDMGQMVFCFYPKVVGFLIKKDPEDEIIRKLEAIQKEYLAATARLILNEEEQDLNLHDVMYVRRFGKKIEVRLESGMTKYLTGMTIMQLHEKYGDVFCLVNRGELINLDYVKKMNKTDLVMVDDTLISISRRLRKEVKDKYKEKLAR